MADKILKHIDQSSKPINIQLKPEVKEGVDITEYLARSGISIEPYHPNLKEQNDIPIIVASQIPILAASTLNLLQNGVYRITFSPETQGLVNLGFANVTGGVARSSGRIIEHGTSVSPLTVINPAFLLYQIGVVVFGGYYLSKISKSLKEINNEIHKVSDFQLNKRSSSIQAQLMELFDISKGILEFKEKGNLEGINDRICIVKDIRRFNLSTLLHLIGDLKIEANKLNHYKNIDLIGIEATNQQFIEFINNYKKLILDAYASLYLNVISNHIDIIFDINRSKDEIESRISYQKNTLKEIQLQMFSLQNKFNSKFRESIEGTWFGGEDEEREMKDELFLKWEEIISVTSSIHRECTEYIQSSKDHLEKPNNVFLLKMDKEQDLKKTA